MKYFGIAAFLFVAIIYSLMLLLPSDIVTSKYATLEAARADHLFGRGWLPDILPPSAYDIRTSNNLDLNISDGDFSFPPSEYELFASHVQPYKSGNAPFVNWERTVSRKLQKKFQLTTFTEKGFTWVFFCKASKGYCEYTMWSWP